MQNSVMAVALAGAHFADAAVALPGAASAVVMNVMAAAVATALRRWTAGADGRPRAQ